MNKFNSISCLALCRVARRGLAIETQESFVSLEFLTNFNNKCDFQEMFF